MNRLMAAFFAVGAMAILMVSLQPAKAQDASAEVLVRMNQYQEEIRNLNGRVEELNFQLLQLQEQIRKIQEDNEFRFQELEDKRSNLENGSKDSDEKAVAEGNGLGKSQPSDSDTASAQSDGNSNENTTVVASTGKATNNQDSGTLGNVAVDVQPDQSIEKTERDIAMVLGAPPKNLGTLKFDKDGNVIDGALGQPLDLTIKDNANAGKTGINAFDIKVASLIESNDPDGLYKLGYDYMLSGDYALAERSFQTFVDTYSDNFRAADANFWLGESYFVRGQFRESAAVFLDGQKRYSTSRKGPENLLKLGLSMAGLNQRELACATYAEVLVKYPQATGNVQARVTAEQKAAAC